MSELKIVAAQKRIGRVEGVFSALGEGFETKSLNTLTITYEGIEGDRHSGLVRASNVREPWYKKGTEMRNEQQLSMLSVEELSAVAKDMEIAEIKPELN